MANTKSWQKVLFIGDSLTRGYDVPYGKGWVELLKAYFEKSTATNESAKILWLMPALMVPPCRLFIIFGARSP